MAKKFTFNAQTPTPSDAPQIDFGAYNKYLVDTVGCSKKPEPQIGIISGVIDLGLQKQDDAKMQWKGDAASEQAELDAERAKTGKEPLQYFETLPDDKGVPTRYKRWPVKAQRCVALTFDVPTIKVNYGQFFAEDKVGREVPFRGLLNNEFGIKGVGKVVGKPYSLREQRNDDGTWSLKNNTILFKIGQATEQLDEKGNFKPAYLGNLIGEAAMFNVQVSTTKVGEKEFLNEKMSFGGPIPQMMKAMVPTLDEEFMYMINFVGEQDLNALKQLRQSVINTMKQAEDFEGSDVQKALIEIGRVKAGEGAAPAATQERTQTPAQQSAPVPQADPIDFDSFDDDIPFAPIGLQEGRNFLHMI
jgi:hypothetical protein